MHSICHLRLMKEKISLGLGMMDTRLLLYQAQAQLQWKWSWQIGSDPMTEFWFPQMENLGKESQKWDRGIVT